MNTEAILTRHHDAQDSKCCLLGKSQCGRIFKSLTDIPTLVAALTETEKALAAKDGEIMDLRQQLSLRELQVATVAMHSNDLESTIAELRRLVLAIDNAPQGVLLSAVDRVKFEAAVDFAQKDGDNGRNNGHQRGHDHYSRLG